MLAQRYEVEKSLADATRESPLLYPPPDTDRTGKTETDAGACDGEYERSSEKSSKKSQEGSILSASEDEQDDLEDSSEDHVRSTEETKECEDHVDGEGHRGDDERIRQSDSHSRGIEEECEIDVHVAAVCDVNNFDEQDQDALLSKETIVCQSPTSTGKCLVCIFLVVLYFLIILIYLITNWLS